MAHNTVVEIGNEASDATANSGFGRYYSKSDVPYFIGGNGEIRHITYDKFDATTAPTANEDSDDGYEVGSRWFDVTNDKAYICLDATVAAAVWTETTAGGSSPLTTKGDLYTYSTVDARLAVGSNDEVLIADSTQATGNKWGLRGWTPIASFTQLGATSATIDIQSIPATYNSLMMKFLLRTDAGATIDDPYVSFNNDTTAGNYISSFVGITNANTTFATIYNAATIGGGTIGYCTAASTGANHFAIGWLLIDDYTDTSKEHTYQTMINAIVAGTSGNQFYSVGMGNWTSTGSAINQITLTPRVGSNFVAGVTYALYGLE